MSLRPTEPEAHLVLSVVAARLRLFDLAQRAYAEALDLDATLADAPLDVGVVRLERRRWARALEDLAEAATLQVPERVAPEPAAPVVRAPVQPPAGPAIAQRVRSMVRIVASCTLVAGVVTAFMALASGGASRVWAALVGAVGLGVLLVWAARQLGRGALRKVRVGDPLMAIAWYAALAAPVLVLLYAIVGGPWPLVAALSFAAVAELIVVFHRP